MLSLLYIKTPNFPFSFLRNLCDLRFLQCSSVIITRSLSSTITNQKQLKETSFTVSYLINSCGLSPRRAISTSKKVQFVTPERPDSVLALLKKHGFTNTQIAKIVKSWPKVLLADPRKKILNKLELFFSIGITGPNLAKLISSTPMVLKRSLSNQIIPFCKFLKTAVPLDDFMLIKAIYSSSKIIPTDVTTIYANLSALGGIGMPQSVIQLLVMHHFNLLCFEADIFERKIKEVIDMGFCPTESKFSNALETVLCLSESNLQQKFEVFRRCGWSEDEEISAFKKHPQCVNLSEKKIIRVLDFLTKVMEMKPLEIAANPQILHFNLKKKIIPRGLVVKILMSNGILKNNLSFHSVLVLTDKCFIRRYVEKYREQIPCVVNIFKVRKQIPQELPGNVDFEPEKT